MQVEVGFKLDKELEYYRKMMEEHNSINVYNAEVRDIYYTRESLDNKSENEIKCSCVRIRQDRKLDYDLKPKGDWKYSFQNLTLKNKSTTFKISNKKLNSMTKDEVINLLKKEGFKKVFDTKKLDIHYSIDGYNGDIQFQPVENIGLLVYYYNDDYIGMPFKEQRKKLIDELNLVGFNFSYDKLGLDKLRTFYYGKELYSDNQNG